MERSNGTSAHLLLDVHVVTSQRSVLEGNGLKQWNKIYSRCFQWHLPSTAETLTAAHSTHMLAYQNGLDTHFLIFKGRILCC
jgi:hypothetical protein